jgi:hypothetical protein
VLAVNANPEMGTFLDVNPSMKKVPTLEEYEAKNPVLIVKDPWGRWIALGEFEYQMNGGCGKPVIYLYPEKPTEVEVKLAVPARFSADIPTYNNGWKVLANSDGTLTDLQKEATDCTAIDSNVFGLEYAKSACEAASYPYLYWSGAVDNTYPNMREGFVVSRANLAKTMTEKLGEIGLSNKEIADMESYWVPEMKKKAAPYYRLAFFQAPQMNKFIPMQVTPLPQTVIRVFLDWSPLTSPVVIAPETLRHIDRKGFTLVEWGGLKQ